MVTETLSNLYGMFLMLLHGVCVCVLNGVSHRGSVMIYAGLVL